VRALNRNTRAQGDVWDTHWDMFLASIGAITAQLLLGRAHDRSLAALR
jgi:putative membrane protein